MIKNTFFANINIILQICDGLKKKTRSESSSGNKPSRYMLNLQSRLCRVINVHITRTTEVQTVQSHHGRLDGLAAVTKTTLFEENAPRFAGNN